MSSDMKCKSIIGPNHVMMVGEFFTSQNGKFSLVFQSDGNLVLYRDFDNINMWDSGTYGNYGATAIMQEDGNLVIYDNNGTALWATYTENNLGATLVLQDCGNIVIHNAAGVIVWSAGGGAFIPEKTFDSRRALYKIMQRTQREEHDVLNKIAQTTTQHKREVLEVLSKWLMKQHSQNSSTTERYEMERISGVELKRWDNFQQVDSDLIAKLNDARIEETKAQNAYKAKAPFGVFSKWGSQESEKTQIDNLLKECKSTTARREQIEGQINANRARLSREGEQFLRGCLTNLEEVAKSETLGSAISTVINKMTVQISSLWDAHVSKQHLSLSEVEEHIKVLRRSYN